MGVSRDCHSIQHSPGARTAESRRARATCNASHPQESLRDQVFLSLEDLDDLTESRTLVDEDGEIGIKQASVWQMHLVWRRMDPNDGRR